MFGIAHGDSPGKRAWWSGVLTLCCICLLAGVTARGYCDEEVEEFFRAYERAYNAADMGAMSKLVAPSQTKEYEDAFAAYLARNVRPRLTVKVDKTRTVAGMTIVQAHTSVEVLGKVEFENVPLEYRLRKVGRQFRIESVRDAKTATREAQMKVARQMGARVCDGSNRTIWGMTVGCFDVPEALLADMVLGKKETFEKANLGWLYEVTADPDRSLLEPTISVRGDVLAVLFKIRSKDGGETEAPLLFFDLVGPKGEGRYAFREPLPEELQIERAYKVFDFWDAVGRTPLLGYVAVAQEGAGIERSLLKVLPEGTPMRPFSVLDEQAWRAMVPGRYVVPLIALKEGYEPFGGVYRSPAVPEEELGAFAALVERWRACKTQEEKVAFLHGIISMPSMGRLASDTLRRLNGIAAFDADLTADELQLWGNVVANEKLDIARRADVLKALLEENRSQIREYVTYALAEPKLRKLIVEDLRASAPKLLRAILIDWLGDPKVRLEALGLGWEYRNDKEFIAAAEESLADAADSEVQAFVPFLLSRNSKRGKAMLIDLIGGDRAPAAKASVFSGLMSANDPEIVAAVRKSVASLWAERKARGAREAVARGMAYLCACRDPAGIEYTKGLLPEFDRDEEMQKHLSNAMMTVSHLPFRNWAACRQWIEALAVEN